MVKFQPPLRFLLWRAEMRSLMQAAGLVWAVALLGASSQLDGCGGPIGWIHRLEKWPIPLTKSKMYTSDQEAQIIIPFEEQHKPQAVQIWVDFLSLEIKAVN